LITGAARRVGGSGRQEHLEFEFGSGNRSVVALGVDLKNSICSVGDGVARLNQDAMNLNDSDRYSERLMQLEHWHAIDAVACDLHPDLHSTRLAEQLSERLDALLIRVQHHHAHIAAVMAEHGIEGPVIGLAMDGFGYGADGTAWGGESLRVDAGGFERLGRIRPVAMPGGDAASRQPWRMAVAWLDDDALAARLFNDRPVMEISRLCRSAATPMTSSAGRLFDAAAAIVLGIEVQAFEGEAAVNLQRCAADATDGHVLDSDPSTMIRQLAEAVVSGADRPSLALGFHHAVADHLSAMAIRAAVKEGIESAVLAGGCFMNRLLRDRVTTNLVQSGLTVYTGEQLPPGDGAVALGQAWVAVQQLKQRGEV